MATFGFKEVERFGTGIKVSADGLPVPKVGGITIFWDAVTAAASDYTVAPNGVTVSGNYLASGGDATEYVYTGQKFIRWGTVMCRISGGTAAGKFAPYGSTNIGGGTLLKTRGNIYILNMSVFEDQIGSDHGGQAIEGGLLYKYRILANWATSQTITMGATGGTFTITYKGQTTSALAYNANAATVDAALEALSTIGSGNATVALSGGVYTITIANSLGDQEAFTLGTGSLTGGTATLGTSADTANGPTEAEFMAAFPDVRLVVD